MEERLDLLTGELFENALPFPEVLRLLRTGVLQAVVDPISRSVDQGWIIGKQVGDLLREASSSLVETPMGSNGPAGLGTPFLWKPTEQERYVFEPLLFIFGECQTIRVGVDVNYEVGSQLLRRA